MRSRSVGPPNLPVLRARYCKIAPDSNTEIDLPSGPTWSMIAGIRLFGAMARKSDLN